MISGDLPNSWLDYLCISDLLISVGFGLRMPRLWDVFSMLKTDGPRLTRESVVSSVGLQNRSTLHTISAGGPACILVSGLVNENRGDTCTNRHGDRTSKNSDFNSGIWEGGDCLVMSGSQK